MEAPPKRGKLKFNNLQVSPTRQLRSLPRLRTRKTTRTSLHERSMRQLRESVSRRSASGGLVLTSQEVDFNAEARKSIIDKSEFSVAVGVMIGTRDACGASVGIVWFTT